MRYIPYVDLMLKDDKYNLFCFMVCVTSISNIEFCVTILRLGAIPLDSKRYIASGCILYDSICQSIFSGCNFNIAIASEHELPLNLAQLILSGLAASNASNWGL